jgi:multidrug efflux pump subunit AcrB
VRFESGYATINREEGMRVIGVTAEVDKTVNAEEIVQSLTQDFLPPLSAEYHVTAKLGSQSKDRKSSIQSLKLGSVISLMVIYLILATIFKSYVQPVIIMLTIPFGLIGAVYGHLLYQLPLTMMSFFGMVALLGIVINDAIVLIESVNTRLAGGMPLFEALREGGKRRFRAIVLTTLTTFAGLFPIIMEKSLQAQILIPMAISIAFGVAFATLSTLILVPCLIAALNDIRCLFHYLIYLKIPAREEVEPGTLRQ